MWTGGGGGHITNYARQETMNDLYTYLSSDGKVTGLFNDALNRTRHIALNYTTTTNWERDARGRSSTRHYPGILFGLKTLQGSFQTHTRTLDLTTNTVHLTPMFGAN